MDAFWGHPVGGFTKLPGRKGWDLFRKTDVLFQSPASGLTGAVSKPRKSTNFYARFQRFPEIFFRFLPKGLESH